MKIQYGQRIQQAVLALFVVGLFSTHAVAGPGGTNRPFSLVDTGEFIFQSQTSADLVGDGIANHMGKILSGGFFQVTGPNANCANGFLGQIDGLATAPDGDELTYTIVGAFCPAAAPGTFDGTGTYQITGGSGRFQNATGGGQFIGLADFPAVTYNCVLNGKISY